MKTETLEHLLHWAAEVHQALGSELERESRHAPEGPSRGLMEYVAEHENRLAMEIAGLIPTLEPNARDTWLYDWLPHTPAAPSNLLRQRYRDMPLAELSRAIFSVHHEVTEVFQHLAVRADVPEVAEGISRVLELVDSHSRQVAQQINRMADM